MTQDPETFSDNLEVQYLAPDLEKYVGFISDVVRDVREKIYAHYTDELPNECVGLVWSDGTTQRLVNQARSPDRFSVSQPQVAERLAERDEGELLVSIYHSHPQGKTILSRTDQKMMRAQFRKLLIIPWLLVTERSMKIFWYDDDEEIHSKLVWTNE